MVTREEDLEHVLVDNRFLLIKKLGYGGQSEVFLAIDENKKRDAPVEQDEKHFLPPVSYSAKAKSFDSNKS